MVEVKGEVMSRKVRILGIDTGGTMTDTFFVDDKGEYIVGKALTTPADESVGLLNSAKDALHYWNMAEKEAFPQLISLVYSGTIMLNKLLERKGNKVGLIVTAGMEDYLRLERGRQTYLGYSYSDRIHVATHRHNDPLVPLDRIRGVRGRINSIGEEIFPINYQETRQKVSELLDMHIDCLCINLLFSYRNTKHEEKVRVIALKLMEEKGISLPIFLSSELYPVKGDFPRLNTLLIEACVADPSRQQLQNIRQQAKQLGATCDLRIMASHGATIGFEARNLARSLISGPIGGAIGGKFIAQKYGVENIVCSDLGGTSIDMALITAGEYDIKTTPDVNRYLLNLPTVRIDSVGAGTGSFVRINPNSNRIEIGPDSAGSRIGMCYEQGKLTNTTITDCNVVLGIVNPDYFLGGEIKIDKDRAYQAIKEQIAQPLGLDVYSAAAGVIDIFETTLRNQVEAMVTGKGYLPADYTLLCYGGGGPVHVGGYTEGLLLQDILVPTWAAGFSAFGCACADYEYRYDQTIDMPLNPSATDEEKQKLIEFIIQSSKSLRNQVIRDFEKSGIKEDQIQFSSCLRMQYLGQLEDIEIPSPFIDIGKFSDWEEIIARFEDLYSRHYSRSARSPELGYFITRVITIGKIDVHKPQLIDEPLQSEQPPEEAFKGTRQVFWKERMIEARIYEMGRLQAGNVIEGLAIIESPATTFVIPPKRSAKLDEHRVFHLNNSI